jgi:hypothetical protein
VEREKGLGWDFGLVSNHADSEFFTRVWSELDYGVLLPIDHSSLWLRASGGHSFGREDSTFSNFYFGGFGNNYVDHLSIRRYREHQSFPGTELNAVEAASFGRLMLEWTLPPVRFRRLGTPGFYANWLQAMLFTSGLAANPDDDALRRELLNVGAQLDLKLVLFSNLPSTLSVGYARAYEDGDFVSGEWMASLNILH